MRSSAQHQDVFRRGSTTYFNASRFFPPEARDDVYVLYGFVRVADDFVDRVPQDEEGFRQFVRQYQDAVAGKESGVEIIDSFVELGDRKRFDPAWADAFLQSMEWDLSRSVYRSIEETLAYIYGSAEVIGLYMARILDLPDEAAEPARMLGRAMQYINFIRDIHEDNRLGRTYLPIGETSLGSLDEAQARENADEFRRFISAQLERYTGWQRAAEDGYRFLPPTYRAPIKTAGDMYNWTARSIERDPFVVYRRTVKPGKLRILATGLANRLAPSRTGGRVRASGDA